MIIKVLQLNCLNNADQDIRLPKIIENIVSQSPDIITFQEVIYPDLFINKFLEIGFSSIVQKYSAGYLLIAVKTELLINSGSANKLLEQVPSLANNAMHVKTTIKNIPILITSAHLAWGETVEGQRLVSASLINKVCENNLETLSILCGDFNTDPDSRTVRFLCGKDLDINGNSTLWLDSWFEKNKNEPGTTTLYKSALGVRTAKRHGIKNPEQLPERRIDYIMVKGWRYGKTGYPLDCYTFGDDTPSDHKGLISELQVLKN